MISPQLGTQEIFRTSDYSIRSYDEYVSEEYERANDEKPLYTGRYLLIYTNGNTQNFSSYIKNLESTSGFRVASINDFNIEEFDEESIEDVDLLLYEDLGVALIGTEDKERVKNLDTSSQEHVIQPEKIVYVPKDLPTSQESPETWGVQITQTINSKYSGNGVKIAVLDTGFDIDHPDFSGRTIQYKSFVPTETIDDKHGHGTHCIGIACGNTDSNGKRYGVANNSDIYAEKVLNNQGSGAQSWILNGINWAVRNNCEIISMSLGSRVYPGQGYDIAYERAAKFALDNGSLIVAASGNESRRSRGIFQPIGSPANCPSILAVAAID